MFENLQFMKPPVQLAKEFTGKNHAPMFRKKFHLSKLQNASLYVCGLGYGYYYINGQPVSEDLFTAPVSNYDKTLWYNVYDVTELLKTGENCIAVWCGNGWYNEDFPSSWDYDKADWRDVPKCILRLDVDGETKVTSDDTWKCQPDSAIWFNDLRSGEFFDASRYDADWTEADYDDSAWPMAVADTNPPKGVFRECKCEPIREAQVFPCKQVMQTGPEKYIFDFGQNMSGYIRLQVTGKEGQLLTIRYAEQLKEDGGLELNDMARHYPASEFQTDRFICSGKEMVWSPRFAYHGFRYIQIEGMESSEEAVVEAVFVHQAVELRTEFECSDSFLNALFRAGQISTYSNMFYQITDCPTREKLGWANDAQSSTEQILTDFKAERGLEKWLQDIRDAMREDGALPGIMPTAGWGYHWGNGPVSDGVLFEVPYRIYLHTGNSAPLIESGEWFDRYLDYLDTRRDENGFVSFGLPDWARPGLRPALVPVELINGVLEYRFCEIAALTARLTGAETAATEAALAATEAIPAATEVVTANCQGETSAKRPKKSEADYLNRAAAMKKRIMDTWLTADGTCSVNQQTAVALLIYYHMYEQLEPLKQQLKTLIEDADFHHFCGMVGLRRLYEALNQCGLQEYAYKIVTAKGYPGYRAWFDLDATTLWEYWDYQGKNDSKNHQMYSDVLSWMVKTILGIRQEADSVGFKAVSIEPYFFEELRFAKGSCDTCGGKVSICWERKDSGIEVQIEVPENMTATFRGEKLAAGSNSFVISGK